MLKNPSILTFLCSPDKPDSAPLALRNDSLEGAGWPVPVVAGVPDFVSHAPPVRRSLDLDIPVNLRPSPAVFQSPPLSQDVPAWFQEEPCKYVLLKGHPKGVLLDVGAGQGNRRTFEDLGYRYVSLDISFNSQQTRKGFADVDIVADCHRLPIRSCSMEVVNCVAVLEHLYCPALAIREACRVLKPGGLFVGSCSFLECEHFDSQSHFTPLGLYRLLTLAGLEVRHIYPGLSLWEMHADSIFLHLPGHRLMGRALKYLYMLLGRLRRVSSPDRELLRFAAILYFAAVKPGGAAP